MAFSQVLQRFHRPVGGLLGDGVVKPGGGVVGVEFLGNGVFPFVEAGTLFLVEGLAQVAADQGVVGIQAGGDLDFRPSLLQLAVTDLGQPISQSGQWVCLVGLNGFLKRRPGVVRFDLGQVGKAQHGLGPGEVRCQCSCLLG